MKIFNKAIITDAGNDLLVEVLSGKQIEFTKLVTGCGHYDTSEELISAVALKVSKQEFCFSEIEKISERRVLLTTVISNKNLEDGYYITEIGIYGKLHGVESEVLYSINTVNVEEADFLPPYNGLAETEIKLSCYIEIKQDAQPEIALGDAMDILLNEIAEETARAKIAEKNNSDALENEVKRAKEQEALKAPINSPTLTGEPKAPTPGTETNSDQIATTAYVKTLIANLVNGAPETLDTLKEIADVLGENDDAVQALNAAIGKKVDKVSGKGLSTNDYTTVEKNKLSGIASGAEVNVQSDWNVTDNTNNAFIKNKPSSLPASDVSSWAKEDSKPSYSKNEVGLGNVPNVTTNDQTPTFTKAESRENIVSGEKISIIFGKIMKWFSDLKTVAFTGKYSDLVGKPTIPSVGNGTITIKQAGTQKGTFTTNQSSNTTIELTDSDTKYTLPLSSATVRGGVKVGYEENGKNYPVELSNEQMYVNVPWTDNNTWKANTADNEGYVAKGSGHANQVWKTNANGVPGWRADENTTYKNMTGATATAAGNAGLVPAPSSGAQGKFLRGDGTWQNAPAAVTPTNNLLATVPGTPLDAVQGTELKRLIDEQNSNLSELSSSLSDTGWITLNSTYTTRYRKKNGIVTVCSAFNKAVSNAVTLGTMPVGYRPPLEFTALDAVQGGLRLSIRSDGVVTAAVVNLSAYHDYCYATISYPV